jgi:hypothetical protein
VADLSYQLNHLLEALDHVSEVSESVAEQFGMAISAVSSTFGPAAANVTTQLSHVAQMGEALNVNLVHNLDQLIGVLEVPSVNHMEALQNLGLALAPDNKDKGDRLPMLELTADAKLSALPVSPELHTLPLAGVGEKKKDVEEQDDEETKGSFDELGKSFQTLNSTVSQMGGQFVALAAPFSMVAGSLKGLGQIAGEVLVPDFGAAGAEVSAATQAFTPLVGVMGQFAQADSPGTMFAFDSALKDVQAKAGTAFTPFFAALTGVAREVADELFPAMQKLQPLFMDLAGSVGSVLKAFIHVFKALEAPINGFAVMKNGGAQNVGGLMTVFEPLVDWIKGLVGNLDFNEPLRHMSEVTNGLPDSLRDPLQTAFGSRPHALAAPENVRTSGIEKVANEVNEAAGRAVGAGSQEQENSQAELFEKLLKATETGDNEIVSALVSMGKAIDAVTTAVTGVGTTATAIYNALPNGPSISTPAVAASTYLETGYDRTRHGDGLGSGRD